MLPDISIEKIRRELEKLRALDRARIDKALLDQSQMEIMKQGAKFMEKHPS